MMIYDLKEMTKKRFLLTKLVIILREISAFVILD